VLTLAVMQAERLAAKDTILTTRDISAPVTQAL
jgi:hypothetical protein